MLVLDSIVLVTGANRGIGRQFVAGLLRRGARRVYVAARRSAALAPIGALDPARVVALQVDITNRLGVEAHGGPAPDLTLLIPFHHEVRANIEGTLHRVHHANVNPAVDHPRWSQATERRLPGFFKNHKTLMFNGYSDQVAGLYAGMDLRKNF